MCARYVGINGDGALGVKESFTVTIKVKLHEFGIIIQALNGFGYDGPVDTTSKLWCSNKYPSRNTRSPLCALLCTLLEFGCGQIMSIHFIRDAVYMVTDISFAISYSAKRTGIFKMMLDQAIQEQKEAHDGRRNIKEMYETRWSSRADALMHSNLFML